MQLSAPGNATNTSVAAAAAGAASAVSGAVDAQLPSNSTGATSAVVSVTRIPGRRRLVPGAANTTERSLWAVSLSVALPLDPVTADARGAYRDSFVAYLSTVTVAELLNEWAAAPTTTASAIAIAPAQGPLLLGDLVVNVLAAPPSPSPTASPSAAAVTAAGSGGGEALSTPVWAAIAVGAAVVLVAGGVLLLACCCHQGRPGGAGTGKEKRAAVAPLDDALPSAPPQSPTASGNAVPAPPVWFASPMQYEEPPVFPAREAGAAHVLAR